MKKKYYATRLIYDVWKYCVETLLNAIVVKITSYGDVKAKANWLVAKWEFYF